MEGAGSLEGKKALLKTTLNGNQTRDQLQWQKGLEESQCSLKPKGHFSLERVVGIKNGKLLEKKIQEKLGRVQHRSKEGQSVPNDPQRNSGLTVDIAEYS